MVEDTDRSSFPPLNELLDRHFATAIAAAALVLVQTRLLVEARLDLNVARGLLRASSPSTIVGSTLLIVVPPVVITSVLMLGVPGLVLRRRQGERSLIGPIGATASAFVGLFIFAPAFALVAFGVITVMMWWVALRRADEPRTQPESGRLEVALIALAGITVGAVVFSGMWFPIERLATSDRIVVGFVLERDHDELVVLRDSDRHIVRLLESEVVQRGLCRRPSPGESLGRSAAQLLVWRDHEPLPKC